MFTQKTSQGGFTPISIVAVVAVLVMAGTAGFFYYRTTRPAPTPAPTASPVPTTSPVATSSATATPQEVTSDMTSLIARGQSLECEWQQNGKLWTAGNKGRSSITTTVQGMTVEVNAIFTDGDVYTWINSNGMQMGFKFPQNQTAQATTQMSEQEKLRVQQVREQLQFTCHEWTIDPSKFIIPSNIDFEEVVK